MLNRSSKNFVVQIEILSTLKTKFIMSESDDSDILQLTPPDVRALAESVTSELLPQKSKARYEVQYNVFKKWCAERGASVYSENVVLAYFTNLVSNNKKSLWCIYSMLKSCIMLHDNIDISKYAKLISYLKRKTANYKPKKSKILDEDHISTFIEQAPFMSNISAHEGM